MVNTNNFEPCSPDFSVLARLLPLITSLEVCLSVNSLFSTMGGFERSEPECILHLHLRSKVYTLFAHV